MQMRRPADRIDADRATVTRWLVAPFKAGSQLVQIIKLIFFSSKSSKSAPTFVFLSYQICPPFTCFEYNNKAVSIHRVQKKPVRRRHPPPKQERINLSRRSRVVLGNPLINKFYLVFDLTDLSTLMLHKAKGSFFLSCWGQKKKRWKIIFFCLDQTNLRCSYCGSLSNQLQSRKEKYQRVGWWKFGEKYVDEGVGINVNLTGRTGRFDTDLYQED